MDKGINNIGDGGRKDDVPAALVGVDLKNQQPAGEQNISNIGRNTKFATARLLGNALVFGKQKREPDSTKGGEIVSLADFQRKKELREKEPTLASVINFVSTLNSNKIDITEANYLEHLKKLFLDRLGNLAKDLVDYLDDLEFEEEFKHVPLEALQKTFASVLVEALNNNPEIKALMREPQNNGNLALRKILTALRKEGITLKLIDLSESYRKNYAFK